VSFYKDASLSHLDKIKNGVIMKNKIFYFLFSFLIAQSIFLAHKIYSQVKDNVVNVVDLKDGTAVKGTITSGSGQITIKTLNRLIYKYDYKNDIENMDVEVYGVKSPMNDSSEYKIERDLKERMPWRNSVYLAAGWGTPQGFRFELGYNYGANLSLGFSFGIADMWSNDPGEGSIAVLGSFRFPIESSSITPYFLLCYGGTIAVFGGSDTYTLINPGVIIPLKTWLQLRPEIGIALTSKHISGGRSLFGESTTEITEDKRRFGFNISLEVDF
jgi:hypothetical protein